MSRIQLFAAGIFTLVMFVGFLLLIEPAFVENILWRGSFLPFFVLSWLTFFWFLWAITLRWKRSLLWSIITTTFIWFRVNQLDQVWNLILLVSFGLIWEYYWRTARLM